MALTLLAGPKLEPVSVAAAKAHLRVDADEEDGLIASLITTARLQLEAAFGLALMTQSWMWSAACWPRTGRVALPLRPVRNVVELRVRAGGGTVTVVDPALYDTDLTGDVARITARPGALPGPAASTAFEIDFAAGYGDGADDVPGDIRQAIVLLVSHWFEHRDPSAAGSMVAPLPAAVAGLLAPYKAVRL